LLGVARSAVYYEPQQPKRYKLSDKELMDAIDEQYTHTPFYGSRRIAKALALRLDTKINRKRVQRLMRAMGIEAIYPKPNTSKPNLQHKIYPYLLRGLTINRLNMVWSTDITYVRLRQGFAYLVAIIDWYWRKVISWELSNTMDTSFCMEALKEAISLYGKPDYFNTDQGAQFTSEAFTSHLEGNEIKISMDGKGRATDNVFIERFWRTIKYENIFPKGYETMTEAYEGIGEYMQFYNQRRLHSWLDYQTPDMAYEGQITPPAVTIEEKSLKEAA
jgi:putative transposase